MILNLGVSCNSSDCLLCGTIGTGDRQSCLYTGGISEDPVHKSVGKRLSGGTYSREIQYYQSVLIQCGNDRFFAHMVSSFDVFLKRQGYDWQS